MHITEFGPAVIPIEETMDVQSSHATNMWFSGTGFSDSTVVCINRRILSSTVISSDKAIVTASVPHDLLIAEQHLSIYLMDTCTDTRSNIVRASVCVRDAKKSHAPERVSVLPPRGQHILISCFPKSGSTLLLKSLCGITGFQNWPMVFEYGGNEQDLYLPSVIDAYTKNTVTQQHVRATSTNLRLIKNYGFKVVVLTRNIFDTLVSLHDHLLSESLDTPVAYVDEYFRNLTLEERLDFLVDVAAPWYLDFYVSWVRASAHFDSRDFCWITYDELINDRAETIFTLLSNFGCNCNKAEILNSLDKVRSENTRLNIGISGRGRNMLTAFQRQRIFEIMRCYPAVDFSLIIN